MDFYTIALFAHIVGVIVIFMSTAIELLCLHRMRSATTTDQLREWASLTKTTAILFPVGGAAMIVSGVYMSITTWSITIPWIALSVAVVAVMSVFGPFVNSRRLEAIAAAGATELSGPIPAKLAPGPGPPPTSLGPYPDRSGPWRRVSEGRQTGPHWSFGSPRGRRRRRAALGPFRRSGGERAGGSQADQPGGGRARGRENAVTSAY